MLLPVPAFPGNAGVAMVCQCHYRREELWNIKKRVSPVYPLFVTKKK